MSWLYLHVDSVLTGLLPRMKLVPWMYWVCLVLSYHSGSADGLKPLWANIVLDPWASIRSGSFRPDHPESRPGLEKGHLVSHHAASLP